MSPSIYSLVYPFFVCAGDEATQYGKNCSTTCHSVWTVANKSFECARCEFCFWCTSYPGRLSNIKVFLMSHLGIRLHTLTCIF